MINQNIRKTKKKSYFLDIKILIMIKILSGNNMISISITSANQKIQKYKRTNKDTELFCNVEKELYKVYQEFKEFITFFIVGGNKIKRFKTLKENNISNGDIIVLIIFDEDN